MAVGGGRYAASLILRRILWGQRCYSGGVTSTTVKVSRFAALDARIEAALPARLKALWNHPAGQLSLSYILCNLPHSEPEKNNTIYSIHVPLWSDVRA